MAAIDDLSNANLAGGAIDVFSTVFTLMMWVFVLGVIGVVVWYVLRLLRYNLDIEIWEKKGNQLTYFGDDKGRQVEKDGVSYVSFLKNKTQLFKNRQYPNSQYLYKKKFFGTKVKYLLTDDELVPMGIGISEGKIKELTVNSLPTYQKIDYLQRMDAYQKTYMKDNDNAKRTVLAIGVVFVSIMLFGLFVIWQSNVATAEATQALASAINADANSRLTTIAAASG